MRKLAAVLLAAIIMLTSCADSEKDGDSAETFAQTDVRVRTKNEKKSVKPTVIIDPGHGFRDPGSCPEYLNGTEAQITLNASEILKTTLEKRGIPCVLTHNGEEYPGEYSLAVMADEAGILYDSEQIKDDGKFSPYERSVYENVLAQRLPNCFFVSLHTNAVDESPQVCGASVDWYCENPNTENLREFAKDLAKRLEDSPGTALKIFEDSFEEAYVVTKYAEIPSVLVEMGYGTNAAEAMNLRSDSWLEKFMSSLADAIEEYYRQ